MRLNLALAFLALAICLAPQAALGADSATAPVGIKKGIEAFSGMVRGTVRVEGTGSNSAVYIDQMSGAAPIRIATDKPADWAPLNGRPVAASGDFMAFNGTPVMLVKRANARRDKIAPQRANIDVKGRVHLDPQGNVLLDTHDGYVKIVNADAAAKLKELGVGVRVRAIGALSVGDGELGLNVGNFAKVEKKDGSHQYGGASLDHPKKVGRAEHLGKKKSGDHKSKRQNLKTGHKRDRKTASATAAVSKNVSVAKDAAPAPVKTNIFGGSSSSTGDDESGYGYMPTPYGASPDNQDDEEE